MNAPALRLLADENFNNDILRGLELAASDPIVLDVVRVQDTVMRSAADPDLLLWAETQQRILLTHDVNTIPKYVYARMAQQQPVPWVIAVAEATPVRQAIDDVLLILIALQPGDFDNPVRFVPVR